MLHEVAGAIDDAYARDGLTGSGCMKLETVDKDITVQSSNIDLGSSLPNHARESILRVASKYFGRLNTASVHFTREGISYRCSVIMQMGALPMKSAEASDKDIYLAFNAALNKVAKQLRRTKREVREDKAERVDKDRVLRDGLHSPSRTDDGEDGPEEGA
jgi:ribosomal subunit interface protein